MEVVSYTRTFTSFSGCDLIPVLNDTVIGEWHGYEYKEKLGVVLDKDGFPTKSKLFSGHMDISIFDKETFRDALKEEGNEFTIFMANEYGKKGVIEFSNINFLERKGGIAIDDALITEKYFFECDDHRVSSKEWRFDPTAEKEYVIIEEGATIG